MYRHDFAKAKLQQRIIGPKPFPSMLDVVSKEEFTIPTINTSDGKFIPPPCEGNIEVIEGFPQFGIKNVSTEPRKIGLKFFGSPSRYHTLVVKLENNIKTHSFKK